MAYTHDVCLMQEVLNEYCFDILGFIHRNYTLKGIEKSDEIVSIQAETREIYNHLFPQNDLAPLLRSKERLQEIYTELKKTTPLPHC